MSRPRSDDRRNAILAAATRVIASHGLGASTAMIAREAGVSNGSLFLYFDTKATLLNALFVELKTEMGTIAMSGVDATADLHEQVGQMWTNWLGWATTSPEKRRALAHLGVAEEITTASHATIGHALGDIADLLERSRAGGPMKDASLGFVLTLTTAIAESAIDVILTTPTEAAAHSRLALEAIWRVIAGASVPAVA